MKQRVSGSITEDGEILEGGVLALVFPKRKNGFNEGWVAMSQNAMRSLANSSLGDQANRVLWVVLAELDFENWIQLNQAQLASQIGMARSHFNQALKKLEGESIVFRGPRVGKSVTFRLNPNFGWKGSAKNHNKALQDKMQSLGISVVGN